MAAEMIGRRSDFGPRRAQLLIDAGRSTRIAATCATEGDVPPTGGPPMSLLFAIASAAYARGTHHYLALDALRRLHGPDSARWQRLFLAHAEAYMTGAKAPDNEFKDFKNHVLHPRDGYWGGAPLKARSWYGDLVTALAEHDWAKAVYAAGVLSHYCTDPVHPFHTAQSEAENNIHRACEWSISRSYANLRQIGEAALPDLVVPVAADPNWLALLVCQGADRSNAFYEKLIAHYDIHRGVVDPPAGLDPIARRIVGELLVYAAESFAVILDRAFAEAQVMPPDVPLVASTLLATLKIPVKQVLKKIADAGDRRQVELMYDELNRTGTVSAHLPEDDRVVRDLHADEVVAWRVPLDISNVFPFVPSRAAQARIETARIAAGSRTTDAEIVRLEPRPAPPRPAVVASPNTDARAAAEALFKPAAAEPEPMLAAPPPAAVETAPEPVAASAAAVPQRFYLGLDHEIVDAPSIGPKMAERLAPIGIKTVGDLLRADPADLAATLDVRFVKTETIVDWQDQARLVCTIPNLRGTHAQLLVGAGYRSAAKVAATDTGALCASVLRFATSTDGQRILRDGAPPDAIKIAAWLDNARRARVA